MMDVCKEIGLGKPSTLSESWSETEICEHLAVSQIRHWYEQPPGKQSEIIKRFIALVCKGEDFANEWAEVIRNASSRKGNRSSERELYFGVTRFSLTAREEYILPALVRMPVLSESEIQAALAPQLYTPPAPRRLLQRRYAYAIPVLALSLLIAGFIYGAQVINPTLRFGNVFGNIAFCLDSDFEDVPKNRCNNDRRDYTTAHGKINLSFMSVVDIEPGTELTLQWLRNGEIQLERPRPWRDAFATDLKYASTHILMEKFNSLPSSWGDPGRYHVRFYVNDLLVDEARFNIVDGEAPNTE